MKRILILAVALGLFLCSTASAGQGGGGEPTKEKPIPKKKSVTKPNNATPRRPPATPARPNTPMIASVMVNSNLPNVTVTINGRTAGTTDSNGHLVIGSLPPGVYTVSVAKPGYQPFEKALNLSAGQSETLNAELMPITQSLAISSTPPESEIFLDDVPRGSTDASGNIRLADVPVGEHRVTVRKSRYREAIFPLSLSSDKEGQINATLELAVGFLTVTTNAPNAGIDISGIGHFANSVSNVELRSGTYAITISSPLYVKSQREVTVTAGQEAKFSVTLEVDPAALSRLKVSTQDAFLRSNDFSSFVVSAKQVIDAGGSLEFNLQHHDFVMPGLAILQTGERIHPVKLTISATSISFDPQVNQEAECSFKQFSVPIATLSSVQVDERGGGLFKKVAGVYLKMELPNPTNPKKPHTLNFVDSSSAFVQDTRGKTVIKSRAEAAQALSALSQVIRYAASKAR
jgi:hypothetical protein